jgi:hypothetical protein
MDADEATVRRFLTILFYKRAQRHLRTLAELYQMSAEHLAELEERFLVTADCAPMFIPLKPVQPSSSDE